MSGPASGHEPVESGWDWAPISPDQVRRPMLRETGRGRRGYRVDDVDMFLSRVAIEIEHWSQRCTALQDEVYRLRNFYREQHADPDAHARRVTVSPEAVQVLARAQAYADQLVADAQAQARSMQHEARAMAEIITAQARDVADEAVHSYRASAGAAYSPDREETERLAAWARSILATMEAVRMQLAAAGDAFALELNRFAAPPARNLDRRPAGQATLDDRSNHRL